MTDNRKLKRQMIKAYKKRGITTGKATKFVEKRIKDMKEEVKHLKNIVNFFKKKDIRVLEFYIEAEEGNTTFRFDMETRQETELLPDIFLSNVDKDAYINMNDLELLDFHAYCASMSKVYEEEKAKNADYLCLVYVKVFLHCLFHEKLETFNLLKKHII